MKKFLIYCIIAVLAIGIAGCSMSDSKDDTSNGEETTIVASDIDETVVIKAGRAEVCLDEVLYYAYTAQATYEAYYLSKGKEIDWGSEMKDGVTWQQGIKSIVLDDICRRECFYSLAEEYGIELSDSEEDSVKKAADEYFEQSNGKLIKKIHIKREKLKKVFEKQKIAQHVENNINSTNNNTADEMYNKWKEGNTVTADEQWDNINYNEPIFTLEDIK
jgi:hypothetical protein